ncbi:hypothetical protein HZH68_014592 [Vespula germanica]|uniref:Uncharacterized protein n=1 Tax=Vespula germanica TaxID=30212 RepID=A0A834MSP4_VESGE|nr:hypothetical protein HZH68_014592 [Vespula germanica]
MVSYVRCNHGTKKEGNIRKEKETREKGDKSNKKKETWREVLWTNGARPAATTTKTTTTTTTTYSNKIDRVICSYVAIAIAIAIAVAEAIAKAIAKAIAVDRNDRPIESSSIVIASNQEPTAVQMDN